MLTESRFTLYLCPVLGEKWHLKKDENCTEEETGFLLSKEFSNSTHGGGQGGRWEGLEKGAHAFK